MTSLNRTLLATCAAALADKRGPVPAAVTAAVAAVTGALVLATPARAQEPLAPVPGIDVSRFQGEIAWPRVATAGIGFAFVQASRGSGRDCLVAPARCGPDERYAENHAGARASGIPVGPYHRAFAGGATLERVRRDARREAAVFTAAVGRLEPGDLRPALDLETPFAGLRPHALRTWARVWLRRVEAALGARPLIYTNQSSWQATGDTRGFARRGHDLWVAAWGVPMHRIPVPGGGWDGRGWAVWQHSSTGRVRGIRGRVDLDLARVPLAGLAVPPAP